MSIKEIILRDFSSRERVHKDLPINLNRLFQKLTTDRWKVVEGKAVKVYESQSIIRAEFDAFFRYLEDKELGKLQRGNRGGLISFTPKCPIDKIGDSLARPETVKVEVTPIPKEEESNRVVQVFFIDQGNLVKAEVPKNVIKRVISA